MPFAVTHILIPIIILDLIRDKVKGFKKKITLHEILVAGVFGILPDIDIAVEFLFKFLGGTANLHRFYTHTLVFPAIITAIAYFAISRKKTKMLFYCAAFGLATHVILDFIVGGLVYPFYPISDFATGLGLVIRETTVNSIQLLAGIDAVVLLVWIIHEERKKKIKDFI